MLQWILDFLLLIVKFVFPILLGSFAIYYLVLYPKSTVNDKKKPEYVERVFTVPNIITFIGIILVPLGVYCYCVGFYLLSFSCFFISGISDLLDGYAASRLNQFSRFGEIIDPIRDRLLLLAGMFVLIDIMDINTFILFLFFLPLIIGEVGIIYLGYRNPSIRVHSFGKARQSIHLFFVFLLLLNKFDLVFWDYLIVSDKSIDLQIILVMGLFSVIALFFYSKKYLK